MFESFFNPKSPLLYPMFAQVALTYCVLFSMFFIRVFALKTGKIRMKYFQTYDSETPPQFVTKASRHFTNLFEIPVLYFVACVLLIVRDIDSDAAVWAAWVFVGARALHAAIHLTVNEVYSRLVAYVTGLAANLYLWYLAVF